MSTLDTSRATPELFAALALAQADVASVGKDGTNTQRGYRYATTEAMIRGSRQHLAAHGLGFVSSWSQTLPEVAQGDIGKQHVAALVTIHWVLGHSAGGQITGQAHMDAIGSPARPPDKAVAAAVTYGLGFVLRGLLLLDRAEEDEHAPDRRPEPAADPAWDRFAEIRERLAGKLKCSVEQAYEAIKQEAGVWPKGTETDEELEALGAAAGRLLADKPAAKGKARAKGKAKAEPTEAPAEPEPDPLQVARDNWKAAAREHVTTLWQDYSLEHGQDPTEEDRKGFALEPARLSRKATAADHWKTDLACESDLKIATEALRVEIRRIKDGWQP